MRLSRYLYLGYHMLLEEVKRSLHFRVPSDKNLHFVDPGENTISQELRRAGQVPSSLWRCPRVLKCPLHLTSMVQVRHKVLQSVIVAARFDVLIGVLVVPVEFF